MFKWVAAVGHFFQSLFGGSGSLVQSVLHDVSSFVNLASPIVADLAAIAKASPTQSGLIAAVEKWIEAYQADAPKIASWVAQAQGLATSDVLRSAAELAMSAIVPAGTAQSTINLAIELAYSVFKKSSNP